MRATCTGVCEGLRVQTSQLLGANRASTRATWIDVEGVLPRVETERPDRVGIAHAVLCGGGHRPLQAQCPPTGPCLRSAFLAPAQEWHGTFMLTEPSMCGWEERVSSRCRRKTCCVAGWPGTMSAELLAPGVEDVDAPAPPHHIAEGSTSPSGTPDSGPPRSAEHAVVCLASRTVRPRSEGAEM